MISVNIMEAFALIIIIIITPPFTAMPQYWNFHENLFEREMEQNM